MIDLSSLIILAALAGVLATWLLPARFALDALALWAACVLAWLSWPTAVWLAGTAIATPLLLKLGERTGIRGPLAAAWIGVLACAFVLAQFDNAVVWIGASFFTLRLIHVTVDWWLGKLEVPSIRNHLRYQLFLPAIFIGPIHRIQNFQRQAARRRWDNEAFFSGLERVLIGLFSAHVLGYYLSTIVRWHVTGNVAPAGSFATEWASSLIDWIALYFTFAGFTAVALGISLMAGIKLEENFNRPWQATNLIDFWTRWHMTLTGWCRDYVFKPVMAITRKPVLGLFAAMLVIGLWHEFSIYYLLWSIWQSLGVILNRIVNRLVPLPPGPPALRRLVAPVMILTWLSLARPVILTILEVTP